MRMTNYRMNRLCVPLLVLALTALITTPIVASEIEHNKKMLLAAEFDLTPVPLLDEVGATDLMIDETTATLGTIVAVQTFSNYARPEVDLRRMQLENVVPALWIQTVNATSTSAEQLYATNRAHIGTFDYMSTAAYAEQMVQEVTLSANLEVAPVNQIGAMVNEAAFPGHGTFSNTAHLDGPSPGSGLNEIGANTFAEPTPGWQTLVG